MNIDATDPNYHHVAVMAPQLNSSGGFVGKVYASHNYALECSQYDPTNPQAGPFLNMSNGTSHAVRITYAPPQSTDASASKQGWLRVWIGQIVRPVVEVPIIATFLAGTLGDAAFVGFTSGSGTEATSSILIEVTTYPFFFFCCASMWGGGGKIIRGGISFGLELATDCGPTRPHCN